MDLNFVVLLFCLTVIAIVAISHGETHLAKKAIEALTKLTGKKKDKK